MQELLVEYVSGNLEGELVEYVKGQIEKNENIRKEYEELKEVNKLYQSLQSEVPSDRMKSRFDDFIASELSHEKSSGNTNWGVLKIAAALALIALFISIGWFYGARQNDDKIKQLESEMAMTKEAVMDLMLQSSASTRIQGVNSSAEVKADQEIISALIFTLNFDENTNVRLAALNALAKFSDEEKVRDELVKALKFQDNPTIQISLINLLVEIREEKAISPLRELLDSQDIEEFVKEEAQLGIFKLS